MVNERWEFSWRHKHQTPSSCYPQLSQFMIFHKVYFLPLEHRTPKKKNLTHQFQDFSPKPKRKTNRTEKNCARHSRRRRWRWVERSRKIVFPSFPSSEFHPRWVLVSKFASTCTRYQHQKKKLEEKFRLTLWQLDNHDLHP